MAPTKKSMVVNALRILVVVAVVLLISLAVYSREYHAWGATGEFYIDGTHTEAGIPHWLIINQAEIEGNAPPFERLPDGEKYRPGVHVRGAKLLLAAVGAVAIGIALYGVGMRSSHWTAGLFRRRILFGYAVPIAVGIVTAASTPTDPEWIGAAISLVLIPVAIIAAAAVMRSYKHAFLAGISVFVSLCWSVRVSDMFGTEYVADGWYDLLEAALLLPPILLLFLVGTLISRYIAGRKRSTPQLGQPPADGFA